MTDWCNRKWNVMNDLTCRFWTGGKRTRCECECVQCDSPNGTGQWTSPNFIHSFNTEIINFCRFNFISIYLLISYSFLFFSFRLSTLIDNWYFWCSRFVFETKICFDCNSALSLCILWLLVRWRSSIFRLEEKNDGRRWSDRLVKSGEYPVCNIFLTYFFFFFGEMLLQFVL